MDAQGPAGLSPEEIERLSWAEIALYCCLDGKPHPKGQNLSPEAAIERHKKLRQMTGAELLETVRSDYR